MLAVLEKQKDDIIPKPQDVIDTLNATATEDDAKVIKKLTNQTRKFKKSVKSILDNLLSQSKMQSVIAKLNTLFDDIEVVVRDNIGIRDDVLMAFQNNL